MWVLQSNMINLDDFYKLQNFMDLLKIPHSSIKIIPFSEELSDQEWLNSIKNPIIFYGSTSLMRLHQKYGFHLNPGVWFNQENWEYENLYKRYKNNLLNADSEVLSVKELIQKNYSNDHLFFVRPSNDLKEFTGSLMEFSEIKEWENNLAGTKGPLSLETKVQIAKPKYISREYRTIIVDKKVIAVSQYKKDGRLNIKDYPPKEIIYYANKMAQLYQPADVFTLDVCELTEGTFDPLIGPYRIIEVNCFNCSGFYHCDIYAIIKKVSEFIERKYE